MTELIRRRDIDFLLYEFLDLEKLLEAPRYAEHDRAVIDEVLETAIRIATDKYATCAAELDENEPSFDGGRVHLLPAVKEALDAFAEAGFPGASFDFEDGGLQMPWVAVQAAWANFSAANIGVSSYSLLSTGVANLICACGSEEQKALYLPPLLEGRFSGTMCLSETQAGSSLSDIRTRAEPTGAGHYLIKGTKMWISGGAHDLTENIIHMVLAKIPGGPPGVKGISLFIVPARRLDADGKPGASNNVVLAGLNHKMGYRGTINTVLNFGESGDCHGWLVGEQHKGLTYMFHMMNEARIGVGLGATSLGYAGYLHSLEYARERPQGRHSHHKDPTSPQIPIIEHADVKRMLLTQKAYVEGALALGLYCAYLVDEQRTSADPGRGREIGLLLDILTPMAKSWPSEFCLEANKLAIQVLGGYGYTRDYPVERLYRDNRLNAIHEGTYGIHGIDLLGRKVRMAEGRALELLLALIRADTERGAAVESLRYYAVELESAMQDLQETTRILLACDNVDLSLANATYYLDSLGHIVIAWIWLRQALVAEAKLPTAMGDDTDFYQGKLAACRYFFRYELPDIRPWLALLRRLDATCLKMSSAWF